MPLQHSLGRRQPGALDLFHDRGALCFPAIGGGLEMMVREVALDAGDQFLDARAATFAHDVVGELAKQAFDRAEPGGAGRGEVKMDPRVFFQPGSKRGMLVRGVVVDNEMQRQPRGLLSRKFLEKGEPFGARVLGSHGAGDPTVEVVERSEDRHSAVACVVVGASAHGASPQGRSRLGSLQHLAQAFLVAAQDERLVRWVEPKANDVPELGLEVRVARKFEGSGQVGLVLVGRPNPLHARRGYPGVESHRTYAAAGPIRRRLGRVRDYAVLLCFGNLRLRPTARRFLPSRQTVAGQPALPANHRRPAHPHFYGRHLQAAVGGTKQNDLRPGQHTLRRLRAADHAFQFPALLTVEFQKFAGAGHPQL